MEITGSIQNVRETVKKWRQQGLSVGFVPTMGYLHEGHKSLIVKAVSDNDKVVVSDFVNPIQFGANEDLSTYPRDIELDKKLCEAAGADLIFHPQPDEMYNLLKSVKMEQLQKQKHRQRLRRMETEIRKLKAEVATADMPADENGYNRVVRKALNYIDDHYHEDISLESMSEVVFLNKNYFSELFKRETGKSFVQYLTEYRLEKAKLLLSIDGLKGNEVADMTGFQNNSYFISVFKKYEGCTPKEYSDFLRGERKGEKG